MSDFFFEKEEKEGSVLVFTLSGYFNDLAAEQVENEVQGAISEGKKFFVMDFEKSQVINSVGISVLIGIIESVVEDGQGRLIICGLNETNRTTFEMMGLFQEAGYCQDREAAVTQVREAAPAA